MKNIDQLSFCYSVKYKSDKSYECNYLESPRPCHNLAFMLEGEGVVFSDDSVFKIKKGDVFFVPQNSTYKCSWIAKPNCTFHSVHFKFNLSKDPFYGKKVPVQVLRTDEFDYLYEKVKIIQEYQSAKNLDYFKYLSAFYSLCDQLLIKAKVKNGFLTESSISPAVVFLENNYDKNIKVEYLASLCNLSPSRFFYLFKKNVGESPILYKNKIAIQKASTALILYKDKSVETIAYEYGFSSPVYFRRLFKKIIGKTPTEFRNEQLI